MVPVAPVTVDLGGGDSGFGFVISGVTGGAGDALNGRYEFSEYGVFLGPGDSRVVLESTDYWVIIDGMDGLFSGMGKWPWMIYEWSSSGEHGDPEFSEGPSPYTIDLGSEIAVVAATLTTNLTGVSNDLLFTSKLSGRLGNAIRMRYVNPGVNNAALGVVTSGRDITVNLATNGSGQITTTALQVANAITASAGAAALVEVTSIDGVAGVVTAMGWTNLSGGAGGLPLPPGLLSL